MSSPTQDNRPISISTPLGKDVLLLESFRFREKLGRPFEMEARLQSTSADINFDAILGETVTVTITSMPTYQPRYFHGVVCQFLQTGFSGELSNYRAKIVSWMWLLSRSSDCRIFQDLTAPEIILQVFAEHGFTNVTNSLTATYPTIPFCVQFNETDLGFVSRLMEDFGIYYFSQQTQEQETVVLCDAKTAHEPFPGYGQIPYNPQRDAHLPEHIYEWVMEQEVETCAFWLNDYDFRTPKKTLLQTATAPERGKRGDLRLYSYAGHARVSAEGEELAALRLQETEAQKMIQTGVSDVLGIAAGYIFSLVGYPRQNQNTGYLTTGVDLAVTTADFNTSDSDEAKFSVLCSFQTLALSCPFRPPRITPPACIPGPQTATVTGPSGADVSANDLGSVRVRFHWDLDKHDDGKTSCLIRVSQPWTGNGWGAMFLPHVGTEVVVCFENGNPDFPVIVGRVYNGDQSPPLPPPSNPLVSYIEDSSQKNLLRMDATVGAEKLALQNAANLVSMDSTSGTESLKITDGKSYILFDTPSGNVETHDANDHIHWTHGDWTNFTLGVEVDNVVGWGEFAYGISLSTVVVGADFCIDLGGRFDVVAPFGLTYYRGWTAEKITTAKVVWAEEHDIDTPLSRIRAGRQSVLVAGTNTLTVGGPNTISSESGLTLNSSRMSQVVDSDSDEDVGGGKTITAGDGVILQTGANHLMVNGAQVSLEAPQIAINGEEIDLG